MPRIVQLSSSNNTSDEEELEQRPTPLPRQRPTYFSRGTWVSYPRGYAISTISPTMTIYYNEPDVYCLTRVIGGKVQKFKKDTRTWLHKSSDKANMRIKLESMDHDNLINRRPSPSNYTSLLSKQVSECTMDTGIIEHSETGAAINTMKKAYNSRSEENLNRKTTFHNGFAGGNQNCKVKFHLTENPIDDDFMGDSDADLTYSEEDTPIKTRSLGDNWGQAANPSCSSSGSMEGNIGVEQGSLSRFISRHKRSIFINYINQ